MLAVLFGALLTIGAAYGAGCALTRRFDIHAALRFGVGVAALSLLLFALMAAGIARPAVLAIAGGAGFACILLRPPKLTRPRDIPFWVLTPMLLFGAWYLVNAMAPEIESDPNIYHFKPAIEALRHGGFPHAIDFYALLPHAVELLYAMAHLFGGTAAARLVHFSFLLATVPLIAAIGRRLDIPPAAYWTAAFLYFAAPVVGFTSAAAYNDAALAFTTLAVCYGLLAGAPAWISGAAAGLCYAIKMTGGLAIPAGIAVFALRRQWRSALLFAAAAAVVVAPWIARNVWLTGNPVAPFFNNWFPNPYFQPPFERQLAENLRTYGLSFFGRFPELLWGYKVQGIIGPVFILLPVALVSVKRRNQRILIAIGALLTIPWLLNAGARFLMPALPLFALALAAPLPRPALIGIVLVHALTSWPQVVSLYAPHTLHLRRFPIAAALGLESSDSYLRRISWDYRVAKMIESRTPDSARILDFHGVHAAHVAREFSGWWQSPAGRRAAAILEFARDPGPRMYEVRAAFALQPLRAVRVRHEAPASIAEISIWQEGVRFAIRSAWSLDASANRWDTPLAFDRNPATRWISEDRGGDLSVDLGTDEKVSSVRVLASAPVQIDIQTPAGWRTIPGAPSQILAGDLRRDAVDALRRAGFTHIAAPVGHSGTGPLGHNLVTFHEEWGLEVAGQQDTVFLFRIPTRGTAAP